MDQENIEKYAEFLRSFTKKNSKKLGERTIDGIITLSKFIETTKPNQSLENLKKLHEKYLQERNYRIATYSLWLYLKSLNYQDKFIKEFVSFTRKTITALNDEEKLAQSVLSKKELFYLVDNIPNLRDKLILKLLYDTGARVSELSNLKLKDVDLNTNEAQLMGKGRKPRTVFFHKSTSEMLNSYLTLSKNTNPNNNIFDIKPVTIWYNLKKYGRELISRDLHPHMLRHTRLQHMADEGVDSFAIKSYAGHSDISTTQIYVKSSKYQRKIAFDKAGDIWENN